MPREIIEDCVRGAGTAPSGANLQPWQFVVVADPAVKRQIRLAAEEREREFHERQVTQEWRDALAPLGVGPEKPFLETAPYLICVFVQLQGVTPDGAVRKHYYARESVGIATGILVAAIHNAGLACLPYTPSRMGFLNEILDRPGNERPFLILVTGHPADNATVPDQARKPLDDIATFV